MNDLLFNAAIVLAGMKIIDWVIEFGFWVRRRRG